MAASLSQRLERSALVLHQKVVKLLLFISNCQHARAILPSLLKGHMLVADVEDSASDGETSG